MKLLNLLLLLATNKSSTPINKGSIKEPFLHLEIAMAFIKSPSISDMIGITFTSVIEDGDTLTFVCDEGTYVFEHDQDCCENVSIEDITGDLQDLVGTPLLVAEESTNSDIHNGKPEHPDSFMWTFYKFATIKGWVDVRWLGESNGYYSESVDLHFTANK